MALISLGGCFEGHFCSQWWETNLFKRSILIEWSILSWQSCGPGKREAGRGCLPECLGPVKQEGHAWAWISYIIIEHLVYVDCNNGEAFIRPVLTLSCSPCGFKHTRASLEDLDAVQALRHLLESPIWETAVRLQRALKIRD